MELRCIVCGKRLRREDRSFRCENNHCFDVAKEGYVNLLRKQGNKEFGDSVNMVRSRRLFFSKDPYKPLKERVFQLVKESNAHAILDLGCGEGYYTNYLAENLPDAEIIGLDISKEAVRLAAKNAGAFYTVASVQNIPLMDDQADLVLNCFSPIDMMEIRRVLKDRGRFVSVQVGKEHLLQLKQSLYDSIYLNEVNYLSEEDFVLTKEETVRFDLTLDNNEDITHLFEMTPYSHHSSLQSKERLKELRQLTTVCEFAILVYDRKDS